MSAPSSDSNARSERKEIGRAAGKVGAGQLAGRVLGLVRDMVFAFGFGAGAAADAWVVAFRIPGLLRYFIAEGAISAGVVPQATQYEADGDRDGLRRYVGRILGSLMLVVALIVVGFIVVTPLLLPIYAPGFSGTPGKLDLAIRLTQISFPYVLLITFASLCMSVLYVLKRFFAPALNTTLFNVVMILALLGICPLIGGPPERMIFGAVIGLLIAGAFQAVFQWSDLKRALGAFPIRIALRDPAVRRSFQLMGPVVLSFALVEIQVLIDIFLASRLPTGSVASLEYANRLVQVPHGIFGAALSTVLLPAYARLVAEKRTHELRDSVQNALRNMFYVLVPVSLLMFLLRVDIVRLVFGRGAFGEGYALEATALALGALSAYLIVQPLVRTATPAFYAMQDTRTPVLVTAGAVIVKLVVSALLVTRMGVAGLALGTVIAMFLNGIALHIILGRRIGFQLPRRLLLSVARIGSVTVVVGILTAWILSRLPSQGMTDSLIRLGVGGAVGSLSYLVITFLIRAPEREFLLDLLHVPARLRQRPRRDR